MKSRRPITLLFFTFALAGIGLKILGAPGLQRVANTTLSLPAEPPSFGYTTANAFPGITFQESVAIVSPPGETNRLFIVLKRGTIQVITNLANPTKTTFLDLSSRTTFSREWGLLGLAFHPDYRNNGYIYVRYDLNTTTAAGSGIHNRLSRFSINPANTNQALANTEQVILDPYDQMDTHNAGDCHFGPDGYLYVSLGDEGPGNNDSDNAQRINRDFFSAVMRIDVDKRPGNLQPNPHPAVTANYLVPADNPFVGVTSFNGIAVNPTQVRTEFWAVGFRNPWRMSFDRPTGRLFVGDVGQGAREEVNLVVKGGNYGWAFREGEIAGPERSAPAGATFLNPILSIPQSGSGNSTLEGRSVTAGVVYRGTKLDLFGEYVFGDYYYGHVWAVKFEGTNASNFRRLTTVSASGPAAFGVDPSNGDVLIAEHAQSRISRLIFSTTSGAALPSTLAATGAFSDIATLTPNPGVVPYEINVPFWSDNGIKTRWFSIPDLQGKITFSPTNNWGFPNGMVWIKHFDLAITNGQPPKRIETRFLVKSADDFYGVTYRYGNSTTDASLVPFEGMNDTFVINDGSTTRTQVWRYPARNECLVCHTVAGGLALGFSSAQLNKAHDYSGLTLNQIRALSDAGYLNTNVADTASLPVLRKADDSTADLELRARSYLAANCSQCHQPGGSAQGLWDGRFSTPTSLAGLIDGPLITSMGDPANRVIKMGDLAHSMIIQRISTLGTTRMPPLASAVLDTNAIALLTAWVSNATTPTNNTNFNLSVQRASQGRVELSWPVADDVIVVEATEGLSPVDWRTITPTITTSGPSRIVTIQPGTTNSYYRLRR